MRERRDTVNATVDRSEILDASSAMKNEQKTFDCAQ